MRDALCREDVAQPHEGHEREELGGRTAQPHAASLPARGELEPRQRVDRDRVRLDAVDVAVGDLGGARPQEPPDALAQSRQIGTCDRAANGEGDLVRPGCRHLSVGPRISRELIASWMPELGTTGEKEESKPRVHRVLKAVE